MAGFGRAGAGLAGIATGAAGGLVGFGQIELNILDFALRTGIFHLVLAAGFFQDRDHHSTLQVGGDRGACRGLGADIDGARRISY
jgi:hypothetical protein